MTTAAERLTSSPQSSSRSPPSRPSWHEYDRQRFQEMGTADHLVVDHASHLSDPLALGSPTGLVLIIRLEVV
jgi:hypothetical protein